MRVCVTMLSAGRPPVRPCAERRPVKTVPKLALLGSLYLAQGLPFGFFTIALPTLMRSEIQPGRLGTTQRHVRGGGGWTPTSPQKHIPWSILK